VIELLRRAAIRASLAPSVHNSQPWRFVLKGETLEFHADWARQLRALDPSGRQLLISCGCAVFNARVALAAAGYEAVVERFPDPARPDVVARLTLGDLVQDSVVPVQSGWLARLDAAIKLRRTNRRRYSDDEVPDVDVDELVYAANAEDSQLFQIKDVQHRLVTASLSQEADMAQNADPAYRAELRAWTSDDSVRRDGVPAIAVPHVDVGSQDDIPIRDFDTRGSGSLPTETHSSMRQCLLLLGTKQDRPAAWLRAGEALERIWLEATLKGYAISPLTQVVEIPGTRERLRAELNLPMRPLVLMRVGRAPATPAPRRRRLVDVLSESEN
jgi:nitroreductase